MSDPTAFGDPENWTGGWYELGLDLGQRSDERLDHALRVLWREAGIVGCVGLRDPDPTEQAEIAPSVASLNHFGRLYGHAQLPSGASVVAVCLAFPLSCGSDWLTLGLPLGALARVDRRIGGFPFGADGGSASLAWRIHLDNWLAHVGMEIFKQVPFQLGLIGFDVTAETDIDDLQGVVPSQRPAGLLLPHAGGVGYWPANQ
jgi:hypothetical protein